MLSRQQFPDYADKTKIDGYECLEHPPARYTKPAVITQLGLQLTEKDNLFALGTVLFEITICQQLYQDKTDSEIRDFFAKQIFPDLALIAVGVRLVIEKCWKGGYNSAEGFSRDMPMPQVKSRSITEDEHILYRNIHDEDIRKEFQMQHSLIERGNNELRDKISTL
ncbi:hypothetical protein G7Y89_g7504 [Cudoniella acicularis]|uniref:Protein kinase domain-containing protein n=1 Tax=Cudoniella acicularis TaxID=354080 RepID=A0A8H4RIB8_9HELO|nr:hypothetical protein G7Y89_g7504 [Cudoniella acicularis]